jgi:predicted GTPase
VIAFPGDVPQLVLKVKFPASLTGGVQGKLDIYDTPGPNEAAEGAKQLVEAQAKRILRNADVVVVVVDFTGMGTTQEDDLLQYV